MTDTITLRLLTCRRCGYQWTPIVAEPKICPACKQYAWRTPPRAYRRKDGGLDRVNAGGV